MPPRELIIGVGSPHGDDAVGWRIVDELAKSVPAHVRVLAVREPTQMLPLLADCDRLWIIDGSRSGGRPGEITRFAWHMGCTLPDGSTSTHGLGVDAVLRLASTLSGPMCEVMVYAIELSQAQPETPLTREVAAAVPEVARRILAELGEPAATSNH